MNALVPLPVDATPVSCRSRIAIAHRISSLLCELEANQKALAAAASTFDLPPTPDELTVTYRGPFGPIQVGVDPEWIRELLADLSPRSRRGRRLRRFVRLHEEHYARLSAGQGGVRPGS
jgi:hypothetical protein